MKYIIMCGGKYDDFKIPKHLLKVNNEIIVERTIRLLKENGIDDISISTTNPAFDYLNVPILKHNNNYSYNNGEQKGWWLDCFYLIDEPVCYILGDVYFSDEAIKTIVNTNTDDIEMFGSTPPFAQNYCKNWIEAFALKVTNTKHLKEAIEKTKELALQGKTWRKNPIIWELWSIIKDTPLQSKAGEYIYNYVAINDYTTDVDDKNDIIKIENFMKIGGGNMIKVEVIEEFTYSEFYKIKDSLVRKSRAKEGWLFVGDTFECDKETLKYLTGNNKDKKVVVKVVEVIPEATIEETKESIEIKESKKPKKKKTSKK